MIARLAATTLSLLALAAAARAAELPSTKGPPPIAAPAWHCTEKNGFSIDIFGFTSGSDVNDLGALSASGAYIGAFDIRGGSFRSHTGNVQVSYGLFPCFEIGPYVFATAARTSLALAPPPVDASAVGGGVEMKYKLLSRSLHGVGLTLVVDPSVARNSVDFIPNFSATSLGLRIFADAELIAGKLYAALNLSHDLTWVNTNPNADNSTFTAGLSLSYQLFDGVYFGAEARHLRRYLSIGFDTFAGQATFVGPTAFWQVSKSVSLSGAWNVQVAGKAVGVPGNLDLTNFNRHLAKAKLAVSF